MPEIWVYYTEGRGNLGALRAAAQAWGALPGYAGAELLVSPGQPAPEGPLYLLVTRWRGEVPALELPAGTKGWAFAVLEEVLAP